MKQLLLLLTSCIFLSCGNTKKIIEHQKQEQPKKAIKITETKEQKDSVATIITEEKVVEEKKTEPQVAPIPEKIEPLETKTEVVKTSTPFNHNHDTWDALLKKHVSKEGNVNYKGFKSNRKALISYLNVLRENLPPNTWTRKQKLAYWINAYNAMTVDLILRHYPVKSIKDIKKPWDQRFWKLGEKWYNLNEIEHQILREMNEPRIHFAIVCASYSCPKLENTAYTSSKLESQLTKVTKGFLADPERNKLSQNSIELSKIFQWFAKDFKQNGSLIDFLNLYSSIKISPKAKKSFKDYNWDLNE